MTHAFSSTFFGFSLWLPENFGLFYCFSLLYVHFLLHFSVFPSGFRMFLDFFLLFLCFMSIFSCPAPYFSLASGCFWTFYCFSWLYVHSHRLCSVLPSGFRMFLDFFPAFLGFMSIFSCSVQCFSLSSRSFWTFFLLFSALCPFSPAQFSVSL